MFGESRTLTATLHRARRRAIARREPRGSSTYPRADTRDSDAIKLSTMIGLLR